MKTQLIVMLVVAVSLIVFVQGSKKRNARRSLPRSCSQKCKTQRNEFLECKRDHGSQCECFHEPG